MGIFQRKVVVAIGQAGAAGKQFEDLRVAFRIQMSRGRTPHEGTIRIWNINPVSAALLEGPAPTVILSVGYGDSADPENIIIPRQIFVGDVIRNGVRLQKEGPDRILTIEAKDGGFAYQSARVNLSFATATNFTAIFNAVAGAMRLPVGTQIIQPEVALTQGGTFSGSARDVLDRIADSTNSTWVITDGVLSIFPRGQAEASNFVPQFSSQTGNLIGSPQKKDRSGVQIRGLLDASIRPGSSYSVQSAAINGVFVADDVTFTGDSGFGNDFYVDIVGKPSGLSV